MQMFYFQVEFCFGKKVKTKHVLKQHTIMLYYLSFNLKWKLFSSVTLKIFMNNTPNSIQQYIQYIAIAHTVFQGLCLQESISDIFQYFFSHCSLHLLQESQINLAKSYFQPLYAKLIHRDLLSTGPNVQTNLCVQQSGEFAHQRLSSLQPGSSYTGQSHTEQTEDTHIKLCQW